MKQAILESIIELCDNSDNIIPIINKELIFEHSKYSSTKESIWQLYINNQRISKLSKHNIKYLCPTCMQPTIITAGCFLRKLKNEVQGCFSCSVVRLNSQKYSKKEKEDIKNILTLKEKCENSIVEFNEFPKDFIDKYNSTHLNITDYNKIVKNIVSFCDGDKTEIDDYDFWPIFKVNNQMRFSSVLYSKSLDTIFKAEKPVILCDNCGETWRAKSIEQFKNCYKILCHDCKLCNKIFKLRPIKNCLDNTILYQSKLEEKFINWCNLNNIVVINGPNVYFDFNDKNRKYKVDFRIKDVLIEIKDYHIWHKKQILSGIWEAKVMAAWKYVGDNKLDKYIVITPNNWDEMLLELV